MNNCDNATIMAAVEKAVNHKIHFYCYRLPGETQLHFGAQLIEQHTPVGFYIQPFVENIDTPPTYISAQFDAVKFMRIPFTALPSTNCRQISEDTTSQMLYLQSVQQCLDDIKAGKFRKLVLSRVIVSDYSIISWNKIFAKLLEKNPNAFVFIFHAEDAGFWIGASPEKYLSFNQDEVTTMALAGTRLAGDKGEWSQKEIDEQAIVADYISNQFELAKVTYSKEPTYTKKAGTVEHLCTEFKGHINAPSQVDKLRNYLHPTPALAGVPTKEAVKYINNIEKHHRRYYGGFIGPVDDRGNFDFYVNLRSLEFDSERYCLYVGSGITSESVPEKEWEETVNKSQTLLNLL